MIAMTRILILGANGQLARHTLPYLLAHPDIQLTLYLRRAQRLANPDPSRVTIIEGDVMDSATLQMAMRDQDLVYANLTGDMAAQAAKVIDSMKVTGLRRLIFISSMGIYGEVPGERYRSVLDPYRDSAALIEASDLDYTILRPGWFNRDKTENYQLTRKGEPFIGHAVSLNSLSSLITRLAMTPGMEICQSLGVSTP
jgi:uncharacterized protein YbjT (DUF2867 family)